MITDSNIPSLYSDLITNKCKEGYQYIIKEGEESKNINNYLEINKFLLDNNFSRHAHYYTKLRRICQQFTPTLQLSLFHEQLQVLRWWG